MRLRISRDRDKMLCAGEEPDYWPGQRTAEVRREARTSHPKIDVAISKDARNFSFYGAMPRGPLGVPLRGGAVIRRDDGARTGSRAASAAADIQGGAHPGGAASGASPDTD